MAADGSSNALASAPIREPIVRTARRSCRSGADVEGGGSDIEASPHLSSRSVDRRRCSTDTCRMHPAFAGRCWAVVWVSVVIGVSGCFGGDGGGASSARLTTAPVHIRVTSTLAGLIGADHVHWSLSRRSRRPMWRGASVDGKLSWIDQAVHVRRRRQLPRDDVAGARRWRRRYVPAYTRHVHDRGRRRSQAREDRGGWPRSHQPHPLRHLGKPHGRPGLGSST
jgi:hypothetical protein